jgi:signal transduction histidine kinase/HPt (histidine-containing phosphotransfer) domain-containing protein
MSNTESKFCRILIVEDNPADAELVREALIDHGASVNLFEIAVCPTLKSALQLLRERPFDVALVDLNLPDSSGLETQTVLHQNFPDLPLVVLSGSSLQEVALKAVKRGAQDYVFKEDLPTQRLSMTVRYAIERSSMIRHMRDQELQLRTVITEQQAMQRSLDQARQKAEDISRLKSEFLANMSHEIRTPMNGVIGMTSLLLEMDLTGDQRQIIETLRTSGEMLLSIINDILDLSKIEAGKLKLEPTDFELRDVIEETLDLYHGLARDKRLFFTDIIDPKLPTRVHGDASRLRQILSNLVSNAIKYTESGQIKVNVKTVSRESDSLSLLFEVNDTGHGLTQAECDALFQPFTQLKRTSLKKKEGTGLGLSIASRLSEMMGGKIGVTSTPGTGSTFWFTIKLGTWSDNHAERANLDSVNAFVLGRDPRIISTIEQQLASRKIDYVGPTDSVRANLLIFAEPSQRDFENYLNLKDANPHLPAIFICPNELSDKEYLSTTQFPHSTLIKGPYRQSQLYSQIAGLFGENRAEVTLPPTVTAKAPLDSVGKRVLVADDNTVNQKVTSRLLNKLGIAYDIVGNGLEAVEAAKRVPYSLILMDCEMPEMDGYQATSEIRKNPTTHQTPIIAMTAYAMQEDRERCFDSGMSDYLPKPVTLNDLRVVLERWFSANPPVSKATNKNAKPHPTSYLDSQVLNELRALGTNEEPRDFLTELIDIYLESVPEVLQAILSAINSNNGARLRSSAHRLKGLSANLGAHTLVAVCETLEQMGSEGKTKGADELLKAIETDFKSVRKELVEGWRITV